MSVFDYTSEYFLDVARKCRYNEKIALFYERMSELHYDELYPLYERDYDRQVILHNNDYKDMVKYAKRAEYVRTCMRYGWVSDYYRMHGVKVVTGVNRCRDRFCYNCQSMDALQRFHEYAPVIDKFSGKFDIYHVVLTQPNVPGFLLNNTLDLMQKSLSRLVGFMTGKKKIRGLDLVGAYGFVGAVRALEVARNDDNTYYHPHYHCMWIMKKGIDVTPKYFNSFSRDYTHRREDRKFTDFEVFLQRIWYLLMNGIKVTKNNLENLPHFPGGKSYPDGFSCYAENAKGHYHEVFKYCTKGSYKNGSILEDFECFRTLHDALFRRKVYQTYGCLYGFDMDVVHEGVRTKDISDLCYNELIAKFRELEEPVKVVEDLAEIIRSKLKDEPMKYISLQSIRFAFDECPEDKREQLKGLIIGSIWDRL